MSRKLEISAFVAVLLAAGIFIRAWLTSHDDLVRLQATLAAQKQTIDAADAREHDRAATLKDTLAQIETLKQAAQSPAQILSELPKYLSLPQPIALVAQDQNAARADLSIASAIPAASSGPAAAGRRLSNAKNPPMGDKDVKGTVTGAEPAVGPGISSPPATIELPAGPEAQIPLADLKPLYDFVQDCRACQAQLTAARSNSADDAAKMKALTQERDAAIEVSKGGSIGRRIRRNLGWFLAGAAAGAIATCASGHYTR